MRKTITRHASQKQTTQEADEPSTRETFPRPNKRANLKLKQFKPLPAVSKVLLQSRARVVKDNIDKSDNYEFLVNGIVLKSNSLPHGHDIWCQRT